ncbi:AAA family ATPase [Devosia sp. A8/3-2]|nr:AAA family ATPase [Devosia sp. A8/3-2]
MWCGDNDAAGLALRQDMAKIFGAAKFWFCNWPEGCKDANDLLRSDGAEAVRELVTDGILPRPVSGLYSMSELPELPPIEPWRVPQLPNWHGKILLAPGCMSVVTGHPGHGKTAVFAQVWHDIAYEQDIVVAVASFETRAKPQYRRILRSLQSGKLERQMERAEVVEADAWINDHYRFMVHPDQQPTLSWLLDMAEVAVVRHGAKVIIVDPWNRLESQRDQRESETEYIGRCLTTLYVFAQDMGAHVQVLAHPSKMDGPRKGKPPELDDIAGSKHWDNRVDQGFVVHRPKLFDGAKRCTESVVYHKKTRFEELGHPSKLALNYDIKTGRFVDAIGVTTGD